MASKMFCSLLTDVVWLHVVWVQGVCWLCEWSVYRRCWSLTFTITVSTRSFHRTTLWRRSWIETTSLCL